MQISLTRGMVDGAALLEQLLDIVSKELDQMSFSGASITRLELFHVSSFNDDL